MSKREQIFCDHLEDDNGIETIDLTSLLETTSSEEEELIELNRRVEIKHPGPDGVWVYFPTGGEPRFVYDKSRWHEPPSYRNLAGQRITPTRIISLLTQNLNDTPRPASSYPWSNQVDEGHYIAYANHDLPHFIADTQENYYCIDETSEHQFKFQCPKQRRMTPEQRSFIIDDSDDGFYADFDENRQYPARPGHILIYVHPTTGQAEWYCPRCSRLHGTAVKHTIPRELRDELARDGLIPAKEYKYKDRLAEKDKLLKAISKNPGSSFYELDQIMGWDSDGRISERIINQHLKDRVELRKSRKGHKGYRVYIKH